MVGICALHSNIGQQLDAAQSNTKLVVLLPAATNNNNQDANNVVEGILCWNRYVVDIVPCVYNKVS